MRRKGHATACLAAATAACVFAAGCTTAHDRARAEATARLQSLADEVWQYRLEHDPQVRLLQGIAVEKLPDLSYAAALRDAEFARSVLERLEAIDAGALAHDDWLTWALLRYDAEATVEGLRYYWFTNVLTPYVSAIGGLRQLFAAQPIEGMQEAWRYLMLVRQVPRLVEQIEQLARGEMERGFVVSAANMPAVIGTVRAAIRPAREGPFAVGADRLQALDSIQRGQFQQELEAVVRVLVNPALERLAEFLEREYAPAAPAGVGLAQYPGGDEYYRYLVRRHTTLEVTPEQVEQIGRQMIAQLQQQMAAIRSELGFEGSAARFREHLLGDPAHYPRTAEEIAERLLSAANAFDTRVKELFPRRPRAPFRVRRLDAAREGSQTYGYYSPPNSVDPVGTYYYNGSHLDSRSWLPLAGIAYHELVPGHHFQLALQRENEALHPLRRAAMHTAYVEGWGSYASYLALEQGMLPDPLDRYGLYMLEIFLATRLVLDPGMNALGMSLEQARAFMRATTFESDTQIATETLRYSTDMPGQALGYQMGKRELLELRERARRALGDRFDLREFHGVVLDAGSLPLSILERHVDWYIQQKLGR